MTQPKARPRPIKRTPSLALPETEPADAAAIKALNRGDATPDQQQRALNWIMKKACQIGGISFDPGNSHLTDFNEGRRFVGLQLVFLLSEPIDTFKTDKQPKEKTR